MGNYYAEAQGEDEAVAHAIEDHYKPKGPDDLVPADPVSVAVALADKIDILTGFWAIDEKPTGSKDPYALRRAALGVIRLVIDNQIRMRLTASMTTAMHMHPPECLVSIPRISLRSSGNPVAINEVIGPKIRPPRFLRRPPEGPAPRAGRAARSGRCRVRAAEGQDDLVLIVRRDRGAGQIPRHRRRQEPARRLQARGQHPSHRGEEGQADYTGAPDRKLYSQAEEKELARAIGVAKTEADLAVARGGFRRRHDARWRSCARMWMRSSTRSRSMSTTCAARQPAAAAQRDPRGDPGGGGFLQD